MAAPTDRPTILQVLPALHAGGVERGTIEMAQAIAAAGHVALVASAGGRMVPAVAEAGGRHVTLPLDRKNPWVIWRNAARLAALIRAHSVDIVHARSRAPAWSAWLACRRTGAHFVTTYHGVYNEGIPGKRRYNAIMARGERVIAISQYVAGVLTARHGVEAARLRIIPRGVDPAVFDPAAVSPARRAALADAWGIAPGRKVVMLPARITRWKGHAVLIDALARLARPDLLCLFVGSARGREGFAEAMRQRAARAGLGEQLRLVGQCDDMPAALLCADVVVNASTDPEGFGRTVIEAQAMGRPVIATDHGGARETVTPGQTGWRVPPGDAAALAGAIAEALALDPAASHAHGARGRAGVVGA
jgi:glycosyltransferase involved in cell wall biosynthesis